jgi:FAD synthetase
MRIIAGGCFNRLHLGHLYFFLKAKEYGGKLTLILTHDKNNFKKNKLKAVYRKKNLENLALIDEILIGDALNYLKTIRKIKPDLIVLGYDQKLPKQIEDYVEKKSVKVVRLAKLKNYKKQPNSFLAKIVSGKKKGAYFMSLAGYKENLLQIFGKKFFPGTLNLSVSSFGFDFFKLLNRDKLINIAEFEEHGKIYGGILIYPCQLKIPDFKNFSFKKFKAWVVFPKKSGHQKNIIEIIHPFNLKAKYGLKNSDIIEIGLY